MRPWTWMFLAACSGSPDETDPVDTETDADTDADADADTAIDTSDTTVEETCTAGVEVRVGSDVIENGAAIEFGEAPSLGDRLRVTLDLHNPCAHRMRFLGHPDAWVTGDGFALAELPPVYVEPGGDASITLTFAPGAAGTSAGMFELPHDRPGSPFAVDLTAVTGPPLVFAAVGDGGHVMSSLDYGATAAFDDYDTLVAHTASLIRGACAGPGRFVAVGGNAEAAWWTSTDGVTWESGIQTGGAIADCAYVNGRFVGGWTAPVWSTDGRSWTEGTGYLPDNPRAMAASPTTAVIVGDLGLVATTTDGSSWTSIDQIASTDFAEIAYGGGRFVAAGSGGGVAVSEDDGATWVLASTGGGGAAGLVYADGAFLLGDGATLYRSTDGVGWTVVNATNVAPRAAMAGVILGTQGNTLYRSTDGGFSWQAGATSAEGLGFLDGVFEVRP